MHDGATGISWTGEIPLLRSFWTRTMRKRSGVSGPEDPSESQLDMLLVNGLGLNFLETLRHLYDNAPPFEEFANWIVSRTGSSISPEQIERINAAIAGRAAVSDVNHDPPVLALEDLRFWDENGYVTLHNALSSEQCKAVVEAIYNFLGIAADDPSSWYRNPDGHTIWVDLIHHPALEAARRSSRIRRAFAQIWGSDNLICTIDRCGVNPPERPGWKFPGPHLHWDTSLALPIPLGVQGLIYLTDTEAAQGAFVCVPGFHRRIGQWIDSLSPGADPRAQNLASLGAIPVAGRAGDMIIWHHALPHGSSPNRVTVPRIVQYLSFYPPNCQDLRPWK